MSTTRENRARVLRSGQGTEGDVLKKRKFAQKRRTVTSNATKKKRPCNLVFAWSLLLLLT